MYRSRLIDKDCLHGAEAVDSAVRLKWRRQGPKKKVVYFEVVGGTASELPVTCHFAEIME